MHSYRLTALVLSSHFLVVRQLQKGAYRVSGSSLGVALLDLLVPTIEGVTLLIGLLAVYQWTSERFMP